MTSKLRILATVALNLAWPAPSGLLGVESASVLASAPDVVTARKGEMAGLHEYQRGGYDAVEIPAARRSRLIRGDFSAEFIASVPVLAADNSVPPAGGTGSSIPEKVPHRKFGHPLKKLRAPTVGHKKPARAAVPPKMARPEYSKPLRKLGAPSERVAKTGKPTPPKAARPVLKQRIRKLSSGAGSAASHPVPPKTAHPVIRKPIKKLSPANDAKAPAPGTSVPEATPPLIDPGPNKVTPEP
jgi:hypothetical protein